MEKFNLPHSLKNIPVPSQREYLKQLVAQLSVFQHNFTWRVYHFLNPKAPKTDTNTYGFKSGYAPPIVPELQEFFDELYDMVREIEFREVNNELQKELKTYINKLKRVPEVVVESDKTRNLYKCEKKEYEKYLAENVSKEYKKCPESELDEVNKKTCQIATGLALADRMEIFPRSQCKMTLKDHKDTFPGILSWRLLNPAKPELGKVSQQILKRIISAIKELTELNLWGDTQTCIEWFKQLLEDLDTQDLSFIQFDITSYYPSINEALLKKALQWAEQYCDIDQEEIDIILTSRESFLLNRDKPHVKKTATKNKHFDVTMGSWDSCEISELCGLFLLSQIRTVFEEKDLYGLYRDDGLGVLRGSGRKLDMKRKQLCKIFKENDLKMTALTNVKVVNFLDVTLDLTTKSYRPYRKPNNNMVYVHVNSDHPRSVTKSIPKTVETRLSMLSSSKEIFEEEKGPYEQALRASGYKTTLEYKPKSEKK